jgi:hypothetical protein
MHRGGKAFLCSTCGHQSSDQSNLRKYIMRHSGEVAKRTPRKKRVYLCAECNNVYSHRRSLSSHMEKKHEAGTCVAAAARRWRASRSSRSWVARGTAPGPTPRPRGSAQPRAGTCTTAARR